MPGSNGAVERYDCYAVMVDGLPHPLLHPFRARRALKALRKMRGMVGMQPLDRGLVLLAFHTEEQAEEATARMRAAGVACASDTMEAWTTVDGQTVTLKEVWKKKSEVMDYDMNDKR